MSDTLMQQQTYTQSAPPQQARTEAVREFEVLRQQSYRAAYRLAMHLTGNSTDADDAIQEAYVRAWTSFSRFQKGKSFEVWLHRILTNLVIDRWRHSARVPMVSIETLSVGSQPGSRDDYSGNGRHTPRELEDRDWRRLPDQQLLQRERTLQLHQAIRSLPDHYSGVVILADIYEFSYDEIAERCHCPVGTVRSRLYRGRRLLKERLEQTIGVQGAQGSGLIFGSD